MLGYFVLFVSYPGVVVAQSDTPSPTSSPTATGTASPVPTATPIPFLVAAGTPVCPPADVLATVTPSDLAFEYAALCGFCWPDVEVSPTWSPVTVPDIPSLGEVPVIGTPDSTALAAVTAVPTATPFGTAPATVDPDLTPVSTVAPFPTAAPGQIVYSVDFDSSLPAGAAVRSGSVLAGVGAAASAGLNPDVAYGWPIVTIPSAHDWWSGTFGIEYDTTNQCWWMNDLIRMYELPASYGTEPENYDDDSWLARTLGMYHQGWAVGRSSSWRVAQLLKVDGTNQGDYVGQYIGCDYSNDGGSSWSDPYCRYKVGEINFIDKTAFTVLWKGDSSNGHREGQQADWNRDNWVLGDSWRVCVQAYPNWVGNEARLSLDGEGPGSVSFQVSSAADVSVIGYGSDGTVLQDTVVSVSGAFASGSASVAVGVSRVEVVAPGAVLDNVSAVLVDPYGPTPSPTSTAIPDFGNANFTCENPVVGENVPIVDISIAKFIGQQCYDYLPKFDTGQFDDGVVGWVLSVFDVGIPSIQFPGVELCVDWYQTPQISVLDVALSLDAVLGVMVMGYLVRRFLGA